MMDCHRAEGFGASIPVPCKSFKTLGSSDLNLQAYEPVSIGASELTTTPPLNLSEN